MEHFKDNHPLIDCTEDRIDALISKYTYSYNAWINQVLNKKKHYLKTRKIQVAAEVV